MAFLASPLALLTLAVLVGLAVAAPARLRASLYVRRPHGRHDGQEAWLHTLTNSAGMAVSVSDFGATLTSVRVPDARGRLGEVTLGHDRFEGYVHHNPFLGSSVGRYANRLAGGRLRIDDRTYTLAANNHGQHLHGGACGFDRRFWASRAYRTTDAHCVEFTYASPHGEEGYPGNLTAVVTYALLDHRNELRIRFDARTDAPTACNLTNHAFFNLAGAGTILRHRLQLFADRFAAVDAAMIATGELLPVEGTPLDFRLPHAIGERIGAAHPQLRVARGYDHCYDLGAHRRLRLAARVQEPSSGRMLEMLTDAPGLQFYSGNFLDGTVQGRWPRPYGFRDGFCLEPGLFPDSPNQPAFAAAGYPTGVLRPGEPYEHTLVLRFGLVQG